MADQQAELKQPKGAMIEPQEPITRASFSFPTVRHFTGKIQYRIDGAGEVIAGRLRPRRGEVLYIDRQGLADALVRGGNCAHVPWDTPLGQPDEFKPKAKVAPGGAAEPLEIETEEPETFPPPGSPAARGGFTREEVEDVVRSVIVNKEAKE